MQEESDSWGFREELPCGVVYWLNLTRWATQRKDIFQF